MKKIISKYILNILFAIINILFINSCLNIAYHYIFLKYTLLLKDVNLVGIHIFIASISFILILLAVLFKNKLNLVLITNSKSSSLLYLLSPLIIIASSVAISCIFFIIGDFSNQRFVDLLNPNLKILLKLSNLFGIIYLGVSSIFIISKFKQEERNDCFLKIFNMLILFILINLSYVTYISGNQYFSSVDSWNFNLLRSFYLLLNISLTIYLLLFVTKNIKYFSRALYLPLIILNFLSFAASIFVVEIVLNFNQWGLGRIIGMVIIDNFLLSVTFLVSFVLIAKMISHRISPPFLDERK